MKIGIDDRMYSNGRTGIGRYVFELVQNLLQIDNEHEYVIFMNEPRLSESRRQGGEYANLPHNRVKFMKADVPYYSLKEQTHFAQILRGAHLDLVHFTHFNAPILYRGKSVVTIHDLTLTFFPGKKKRDLMSRLAYKIAIKSIIKHAEKVIAVSEHTARDIAGEFKVPSEKIRVAHLGVDKAFHHITDEKIRREFIEKMNLPKPFLLYTGVWRSHKNLVNLIRAFALVRNDYGIDCMLVITGKEDPWYPEVKETVVREGLDGEVRFAGYVPDEDLIMLYNTAELFVFPSLYEGFGLPVLEAFACGTPVIASNTSSLPEICGLENAVFFDPYQPQEMAKQIAMLYHDTALRSVLRERGLARAKDFSWRRMAEQTLAVYNEALGK